MRIKFKQNKKNWTAYYIESDVIFKGFGITPQYALKELLIVSCNASELEATKASDDILYGKMTLINFLLDGIYYDENNFTDNLPS